VREKRAMHVENQEEEKRVRTRSTPINVVRLMTMKSFGKKTKSTHFLLMDMVRTRGVTKRCDQEICPRDLPKICDQDMRLRNVTKRCDQEMLPEVTYRFYQV